MRALSDVRGETHEDRLRDAGLTTLKERRKRGTMQRSLKISVQRFDKQASSVEFNKLLEQIFYRMSCPSGIVIVMPSSSFVK